MLAELAFTELLFTGCGMFVTSDCVTSASGCVRYVTEETNLIRKYRPTVNMFREKLLNELKRRFFAPRLLRNDKTC